MSAEPFIINGKEYDFRDGCTCGHDLGKHALEYPHRCIKGGAGCTCLVFGGKITVIGESRCSNCTHPLTAHKMIPDRRDETRDTMQCQPFENNDPYRFKSCGCGALVIDGKTIWSTFGPDDTDFRAGRESPNL